MEKIEEWVKVNENNGSGSGYGNGSGSGTGYDYGNGNGSGSGYGNGNGNGYGNGNGNSSGTGTGYGYGYGSGYGYKYNNNIVYNIDDIRTIIRSIKGQIAKGFIINNDLTLINTFVVKSLDSKYFAHGKAVKEAFASLEEKIIADLDVDERIEMFLKDIDKNKKYPLQYFFEWHGKLTGSCLQGRESFIFNKGLTLEDEMDFNGFVEICENQYGWEVIKQLI